MATHSSNSMDRGPWQAAVHGITWGHKESTQLGEFYLRFQTYEVGISVRMWSVLSDCL